MGRHTRAEDPALDRPDGRVSTGYHRAVGKKARRRIATWPILSGAFVVLLVVGLLGWGWANSVLNSRAEAQADGCAEGDYTMNVLVAPDIERPVSAAATKWNQAKTVVRSHCVRVEVRALDSERVFDALTGRANLDSIGGLPAAWIPETTDWVNQLSAARPDLIGSPAEPVVAGGYPFVGLDGQAVDEVGVRAAQVFRDFLKEPAQQAEFTQAGLSS